MCKLGAKQSTVSSGAKFVYLIGGRARMPTPQELDDIYTI